MVKKELAHRFASGGCLFYVFFIALATILGFSFFFATLHLKTNAARRLVSSATIRRSSVALGNLQVIKL